MTQSPDTLRPVDSASAAPRPPSHDVIEKLLVGPPLILGGALLLMIGLLAVEALIGGLANRALGEVVYYILRGAIYLIPFGLAAWTVHRSGTSRQRLYWVLLALGWAFFVSPLGFLVAFIVFAKLFSLYLGPAPV